MKLDLSKLADTVTKVASLAKAHADLNTQHASLAQEHADLLAQSTQVTGAQDSLKSYIAELENDVKVSQDALDTLTSSIEAAIKDPAGAVGLAAVAAAVAPEVAAVIDTAVPVAAPVVNVVAAAAPKVIAVAQAVAPVAVQAAENIGLAAADAATAASHLPLPSFLLPVEKKVEEVVAKAEATGGTVMSAIEKALAMAKGNAPK